MTQASLILFLAGDAIEGVVHFSDGRRMRLEEDGLAAAPRTKPDWTLQACNAQDAGLAIDIEDWSQRFAAAQRQAAQQCGEPPQVLRIVVPPDLLADSCDRLVVAGHLAGFTRVDSLGLELLLSGHEETPQMLVQWGRAGLRAWRLRCDKGKLSEVLFADLSPQFSAESIVNHLCEAMGLTDGTRAEAGRILPGVLAAAMNGEHQVRFLASDDGPPEALFIGSQVLKGLGDKAIKQLSKELAQEQGPGVPNTRVLLFGTMAALLVGPMNAANLGYDISAELSLQAPLEAAFPPPEADARLRGRVSIVSQWSRRIVGFSSNSLYTLDAGIPLPAISISERFQTATLLDEFSIEYCSTGGDGIEIGVVAVPRLLEGRIYSQLRVKILADSERFLVLNLNLASGMLTDTIIFDKRNGVRVDLK